MPDIETLQAAYESFNKGDIEKVVAAFDDGIEWHGPDVRDLPGGGVHRGPREVADEVFSALAEKWEKFELDPREFVEGDNTIVVLGRAHVVGKESGREDKFDFAHAWKFRDGKISRCQIYTDTAAELNALFDPDNTGYPRRG